MGFPRLLPVDATPGVFWAMDETYGYGKHYDSGSNIERKLGRYAWATGVWEVLADVNSWGTFTTPQIEYVMTCPIGNFVLIEDIGTSLAYIYFSTSWTSGWTEVVKLGWDGSSQNPDVSILQSICYDEFRNCVYLGEYNTSSGTLAAGRYLIRLLRTTDGTTWTQLCEWNRASTTQGGCSIRHWHGIRVDPFTGYVWLVSGDSADQSHHIEWIPEEGTWANDIAGATINDRAGFRCINGALVGATDDRCRGIIPTFSEDFCYYARDGSDSDDGNLWRIRKSDFAHHGLPNNNRSLNWGTYAYDGWSTLRLRDGRMLLFMISNASTQTDQNMYRIYANSAPDDLYFHPVACINTANGFVSFPELVDYIPGTDRIIISYTRASGMRQNATHGTPGNATVYNSVMVELDTIDYRGWRPDIISPVRWVSQNGTNSIYGGQTPRDPLQTLTYALQSNVTFGTRIMLSEGTHDVTETAMRWNTTIGAVGYTGDEVWVTGKGRDRTFIRYAGASSGTMLTNGFVSHNLILESLAETSSTQPIYTGYTGSGSVQTGLVLIDCEFGDYTKTSGITIAPREGYVRAMGSLIKNNRAADANTKNCIDTNSNTTGCEITLVGTVVDGGYSNVRCDQANVTLNAINCGFTNSGLDEALYFVTTAPVMARVHNTAFNGTNDIKATATPTAYDIRRVYAVGASAALSGAAARIVTSGALWADAANGDFTPLEGSTLIEAGEGVRLSEWASARWAQNFIGAFGFGGVPFRNPATIGPVEYN